MAPSATYRYYIKASSMDIAVDAASICYAISFIALILVIMISSTSGGGVPISEPNSMTTRSGSSWLQLVQRPCDEIYVVGEGETLHTISDRCGDPYIVERNPHIHDPDDVFPGLVIKIVPLITSTKSSSNQ